MENEINSTPTPIEINLSNLFTSSQPRKEFVDDLAMRLHFQYLEHKSSQREISPKLDGWFLSNWKKLMARPVLLVMSVLIAVMVLTGIVYAVGRLSGYIPGFGFSNGNETIYVLEETVVKEENGMILSVEQAVSDKERFWVKLQVENLEEFPFFSSCYLLLEDGTRIELDSSGGSYQDGPTMLTFTFPPLPTDTTNLTLFIEGLQEGTIEIPLVLRPIRKEEILPVEELGEYPILSPSQHGLQLSLDHVAPGSDRTVFQVSIIFDEPGTMINGQWTVTLQDQEGRVYPLTEITSNNIDRGKSALFQTMPFTGNEELVLTLQSVPIMDQKLNLQRDYSTNPGKFVFDPGPDPQPGQVWEMDDKVHIGDLTLQLIRAELNNANELTFEFTAQDDVTGVMLYAETPDIRNAQGGKPTGNGNFTGVIGLNQFSSDPIEFQIRSVYFSVAGEWQINWTPPAAPDESTAQVFATATVPVFPTATTTIPSEDALYLEVKRLSDQFDAPYQQGPGWVHIVREQHSKVEEGQLIPPAYYKTNEWYEVDPDGYIQRFLYTEFNNNGAIIQQSATVGNYSVNFTFGSSGYNELEPRRISLDRLNESFRNADEYKSEISGEEVDCQDGKRCLLISVKDLLDPPIQPSGYEKAISGTISNVWIDKETGLQFKFESIYLYEDGSEEVRSTRQVLLVEKVDQVPEEVIGILDRVVLP
ncbi:MAG TPA: hypothetical protein VK856_05285 [Anaerolineaceae bacterium]|nr:hypothetical protein [Anaerolineaceae bacterium]